MSKSYSVGYYATAFLDILGQQEEWKDITALPENEADLKILREKLARTVEFIDLLRRNASSISERSEPPQELVAKLSGQDRADFLKSRMSAAMSQSFSDCIVFSASLEEKEDGPFPTNDLFFMLTTCCNSMILSMAASHALRGGIDVQVGVRMPESGEIYGPALNSAYALESKAADYPRVLIGDGLMKYLNAMQKRQGSNNRDRIARGVSERCLKLITKDTDGRFILDYLGSGFVDISDGTSTESPLKSLVMQVKNHIENQRKIAQQLADSRRIGRYERLISYFNRCSPFGERI